MKLYFADGTSLEVHALRGSSQYIQGTNRDVLTIEIKPEVATLDELRQIFQNKEKTKELTTADVEKITNDEGEVIEEREITKVVGQNYLIYLSIGNEIREISNPAPGIMQEPKREELNHVKIAQLTYTEYLLEQVLQKQIYST